jgi:hypothetical protein
MTLRESISKSIVTISSGVTPMEQGSAWMEHDGGAQNLKIGRNRGRKLLIQRDIKRSTNDLFVM